MEEKIREEGRRNWNKLDERDLIENIEEFECSICLTDIEPGEGIQLRNCTHQFCK
jgi:hypothetical protein